MLIEAEQLQKVFNLGDSNLLCCLLKPIGNNVQDSLQQDFIPGSTIFDIDEFSQSEAEFSHTLLNSQDFESRIRTLGVNNDSQVVVYDNIGIYSSPRIWFNLKLMGCKTVLLLDGGLPSWKENRYPTINETRSGVSLGDFSAKQILDMVVTKEEVLLSISNPNCRIIDVRSSGRFFGTEPEPREGVRSGHIPSSINIPFTEFIEGYYFKKKEALQKIFEKVGCGENEKLIFLCGSGVTACIGYFAAHICEYTNCSVYDGAWTEWGSIEELPIDM